MASPEITEYGYAVLGDIDELGRCRKGIITEFGLLVATLFVERLAFDTGIGIEHWKRIAEGEIAHLEAFLLDTDEGTEAEVNSFLSRLFKDSGAGTDLSELLSSLSSLDAGTGVDLVILVSLLKALDSATGTDLTVQMGRISKDSGAGTDLAQVLLFVLDSGSGADLVLLTSILKALDSATGTETYGMLDRLLRESGSVADLARLVFANKFSLDDGVGIDLPILQATLEALDSGTGIDLRFLVIVLKALDSASGTDLSTQFERIIKELASGIDLAQLVYADWFAKDVSPPVGMGVPPESDKAWLTAVMESLDSGTGIEASLLEYLQQLLDSGSGTDVSVSLEAMLQAIDSASATDLATLLGILAVLDKGTGVELTPFGITLPVSDGATGVDLSILFKTILVKMLVSILSKASMLVETESKAKMDTGIGGKVSVKKDVDGKASLKLGVDKKSKMDVSLLGGGSQ